MALTLWIEAEDPEGASKVKQMEPCIFCQYYPVPGLKKMPFMVVHPMTSPFPVAFVQPNFTLYTK